MSHNPFAIVISKITDHTMNIIITIKCRLLGELPKVTQRPEVSKCFWKNGTSRFAQFRITPKLQFIKNAISLKGSKTIK